MAEPGYIEIRIYEDNPGEIFIHADTLEEETRLLKMVDNLRLNLEKLEGLQVG